MSFAHLALWDDRGDLAREKFCLKLTVEVQFTVGLKLKGKAHHIAVDAEDALIAALKVKTGHPEAVITYVRQQNRRGDARHPSHTLAESLVDE